MSDAELIRMLRSTQIEVNKALKIMQNTMKTIPLLRRDIKAGGGNEQDFQDIASEALFAVYKNVRDHSFKEESALSSYFYQIAKYRWYTRVRKTNKVDIKENSELPDTLFNAVDDYIDELERKSKASKILEMIGNDCKKIMTWYYYDGEPVSKIAELLNINYQTVKNKLFNCRAKAKEFKIA